MLQFYSVCDSSGHLAMSLIEDSAETFPEIRQGRMVSCLSLPPPTQSVFDWIVVGDSTGKLYGFRFDMNRTSGLIEMNSQTTGRFRTNTHEDGVAVQALVATHGSQDVHYKAVVDSGLDYAYFMKALQKDDKTFFSLGENGRLLNWTCEKRGWQSAEGINVPSVVAPHLSVGQPSESTSRFAAAHGSRLVPHVLVLADAGRRLLLCFNRLTNSVETICPY